MTLDAGLQAFVEESRELLEEIEDTLLKIEETPDNADLVNELFRAVHTIKGASGLFGFDHVVEFTHLAESVMGRVRDGEISITKDLLTLLLSSRDHISELVEAALNGNQDLDAEVIEKGQSLTESLSVFMDDGTNDVPTTSERNAEAIEESVHSGEATVTSGNWHISLRFGEDVLRNGMDPLSFIRYLKTLGDVVSLMTLDNNLPVLEKLDPTSCYLGFEIDFKSEANKQEIEDVFEFVQDDCVIHILPPHSYISQYVHLIEALPEEKNLIGEILKGSGALTEHELREILAEQKHQGLDRKKSGTGTVQLLGELAVKNQMIQKPVVDAALKKQKKNQENQVVRVSATKLEELINVVGELVISGANTHLLASQSGDGQLMDAIENMSNLVEDIRDTALSMRMVPIGKTFDRFRRVVREVSRDLGKEIELVISGGDTELDKTVVDKISDPLTHLVRNSIDHGVEKPTVREECGKPTKGVVHLNAYHDSGSIVIEISDDGQGLSKDKILAKALEKGLVKENQSLSDNEIYRLIFEPGFSTAETVSNISGRGVGMDVVRRNIDALRGQVNIESEFGKGSKIIIRLPLTLAIIDGFLVQVGSASYVIPLDLVDECVEFDEAISDAYKDSHQINLRGEILPYVRLAELFNIKCDDGGKPAKRENIIVARYAGKKAGLVVDDLLGEYQTVIKPLGQVFENLKGLSGATILGSGDVAMIVDVPALVDIVSRYGAAGNAAVGKSSLH